MEICSFLQTDRLILRGLLEEDIKGNYFNWFNDLEVCEYNSHHRFPVNEKELENYILNTYNRSNIVLAIIEKSTKKHIGNISIQNINFISRCAEFAIIIGEKNAWGKGYGKEAGKSIIEHAVNQLGIRRIYCGTHENNIGMQKLAISLGMKEEGRRKEAIFKNGEFKDILEYGGIYE